MKDRIQKALKEIRTEDELKQQTLEYVRRKRMQKEKAVFTVKPGYGIVVAACLFLLLTGGAGYSIWQRPVSIISIDVNPSMELELNLFDRVVKTSAYNDEAKQILKKVSVRGKRYEEAIDIITKNSEMQEYLNINGYIEFAVASEKKEKEKILQNVIENTSVCRKYESDCEMADFATVHEAHDNCISIGKYKIYQQLSEYDENVTLDQCRHQSMRTLHEKLEGHCKKENGEHCAHKHKQ